MSSPAPVAPAALDQQSLALESQTKFQTKSKRKEAPSSESDSEHVSVPNKKLKTTSTSPSSCQGDDDASSTSSVSSCVIDIPDSGSLSSVVTGLASLVARFRVIRPSNHNTIDVPVRRSLYGISACDAIRKALDLLREVDLDALLLLLSPTLIDAVARIFLTYGMYADTRFTPRASDLLATSASSSSSSCWMSALKQEMNSTGLAFWQYLRSRPDSLSEREQAWLVSEVAILRRDHLNAKSYKASQLVILQFLEQHCDIEVETDAGSVGQLSYRAATLYDSRSPYYPRRGVFAFVLGQLFSDELVWIEELIATIPRKTANYVDLVKTLFRESKEASNDATLLSVGHLHYTCNRFAAWMVNSIGVVKKSVNI